MSRLSPLDLVAGVVAGLLLLLWRAPMSQQDSQPPRCWNAVGSEIPCDYVTGPAPYVLLVGGVALVSWVLRSLYSRL